MAKTKTADEKMIEATRALNAKNKLKDNDGNNQGRIISVDGTLKAETPDRKRKEELIKFTESKKANKVLTGIVDGIETLTNGEMEIALACVNMGSFKVVIPVSEFQDFPTPPEGRTQDEYDEYCLSKRLGSEIDFIVTTINKEDNLIAASRKMAMEKKRKEFLLTKNNGNYFVYDGAVVEARVIATTRGGVFLEIFGCETFVPNKDCKYTRFSDATEEFEVGERVTAKIMSSERNEKTGEISIVASIKDSYENPIDTIIEKYHVDSKYIGTVKFINDIGIFVELNGEVSVLCGFNDRFPTPIVDSKATIRIISKDEEKRQLWGRIIHISKS